MEWSTLYSGFANTARDEGFPEVSDTFGQILKVEKFHEARYRKLIANISKKEVFRKRESVKWHCANCGYVLEGAQAPDECPACKHPQAFFELYSENF